MAKVELKNLTKIYGQNTVVDHINLEIENGTLVSILGPSGCGKTTTLRMIAGFEHPEDGDVLFDGQSVGQVPVNKRKEKHPEITTIVQNINGRGTSMVLGDKEHVLYGKGYIVDELCGCRFRISSKSFYQVNPVQTEILYEKALSLAGLTGQELVVDAYCGIGTIGIIASKAAGKVIGVELNQDAVRDAVNNAKMNGIENIRFYCNDAGRFLVNMAEQGEKADVVIMDPPRSGSTEEFMDAVGKLGAEKVVYVSCNPETLARDVRYMKKMGYRAAEAWLVDMFPGTVHVETACLLVRKP